MFFMNEQTTAIDRCSDLVLFEDNHLLVVRKPAGLLSQGDRTGRANLLDLAKDYIKAKYRKPGRVYLGLVHRLDRQAGGVMVLARTSKAAGRLSDQFRRHQSRKIYRAVVHGVPRPGAGISEVHLAWQGRRSVLVQPGPAPAQPAKLAYRTLDAGRETSLIEVELITGRRHQVRAQLAGLGHPLVGDRLYGSALAERAGAIGLWAVELSFMHPTSQEDMTFRIEPPPDWPWLPLW